MKSFSAKHVIAMAVGSVGLFWQSSHAVPLWWDTSDDPGLQAGDGTWSETDANWNPAANGLGIRQIWDTPPSTPNGFGIDAATFDVGGNVSFVFNMRATSVTFNVPVTVINTTSASLFVDGDITVAPVVTASVRVVSGADGTAKSGFNKAGTGTLIVDAVRNSGTTLGTYIKAGTVKLGAPGSGESFNFGGTLQIDSGAVLELNNNVKNVNDSTGVRAFQLKGASSIAGSGGTVINSGDLVRTFYTSPGSDPLSGTSSVAITGNISLVKEGTRTLTPVGTLDYKGSTRLSAAGLTGGLRNSVSNTLPIHTDLILDTSTAGTAVFYTLGGTNQEVGAIHNVGSGTQTIQNGSNSASNRTLTINGQIYDTAGSVPAASRLLTDLDSTFSGQIIDASGAASLGVLSLAKANNASSKLTLSGANKYTGSTAVTAGTLLVNGTHIPTTSSGFLSAGTATYTIATGGILGGTGTIGAQVNITSSGHLAPGTSVGTLTVASLSLDGSALDFEVSSAGADRVNVTSTGGLRLSGVSTFTLTDLGGAIAGTYPLIDYDGTALTDLSAFTLASTTLGALQASLFNNTADTRVELKLEAASPGSIWTGEIDASWTNPGNWTGGVPNAVGAVATFAAITSGQFPVNVDGGNKTVGTINFDNATSYSVGGGGPITLDVSSGQAGVNILNGSHSISTPLTLNDDTTFSVTPVGSTLTLGGTLTATGRTITKSGAGVLAVSNVRADGLNITGGKTRVTSNGSTSGVSKVTSLSITGASSTLDLTNNHLVVNYSVATPVNAIAAQVTSGYAGGTWTGPGITSSTAAAIAADAGNTHKTALGYAKASEVGITMLGDQTADPNAVIVRYTYVGDATLDGKVNTVDFNNLAGSFGQSGKFWVNGDFNYDGSVDSMDFSALTSNYGLSLPIPAPTPGSTLGAVVPEPASFGLLALGAIGLVSRRRRA